MILGYVRNILNPFLSWGGEQIDLFEEYVACLVLGLATSIQHCCLLGSGGRGLCFSDSASSLLWISLSGWKTHRYPGVKRMFPELTKISSNTQWPACPCSFPESSLKHLTPGKAGKWPNQTKCSSVWRRFPNMKWKLMRKWSQTPRRRLQSRNRLQNKTKNPKQVQAHLFVANGLLILLKKICGLETWTMLVGHPQIFSLSNNLCSLFPQYFHFYLMN